MNTTPFVSFGIIHFITSFTVLFSIFLAIRYTRSLDHESKRVLERRYGLFLIFYYIFESCLRHYYLNVPWIIMLPVEVCAALTFIGAYAHFKRSQLAYEIIFFWTFALTLHSLITPTPADGFPSVEYFRYFFSHGILILNAFYVFLVLKVPLSFRALLRSFLALQVLVILAALSDWSMAQNFMFLVHKPAFPTSMDGMGPWPYYIGTLELTTLFSFALWWGIAKWIRKNASRQASVIA